MLIKTHYTDTSANVRFAVEDGLSNKTPEK